MAQPLGIGLTVCDQARRPSAVTFGPTPIRKMKVQAAVQEHDRRGSHPHVPHKSLCLRSSENQRSPPSVVGELGHEIPNLAVWRIEPHAIVPGHGESLPMTGKNRAWPRLWVARAWIQIERPERVNDILWSDPIVGSTTVGRCVPADATFLIARLHGCFPDLAADAAHLR